MTEFEKLLSSADANNIEVYDNYDLSGTNIKGLYCDGTVAISNSLSTEIEKTCVLAEELGHYHTTTGNILDQSKSSNRKQELRARLWAYNKQIGLQGIINCHNAHCSTTHEMAEYLNVTEEFFIDAINTYKHKYGIYTTVDNYIVGFEPNLYVLEKLEQQYS